MTSELRPVVEVLFDTLVKWDDCSDWDYVTRYRETAAVIEADREAVRAEQAAELAKFKALAETLAEALNTVSSQIVYAPIKAATKANSSGQSTKPAMTKQLTPLRRKDKATGYQAAVRDIVAWLQDYEPLWAADIEHKFGKAQCG